MTSQLMRVPASGGEPTEVLDTRENIVAVCFGPDGDRLVMLAGGGLEVFEFATKQRRLILPWGNLDDAQYQAGGLIWSKEHDTIAFAVFNRKAKRHELRTIRSDGSNPKVIYTQDESEGKIMVSSFVRP